ncbi:OLC1v1034433C1 [Oldenlandia corymbosa var. corymbosa]|uniref:OLC1v1034433C1 n=1 Tax=Oldenlandia corymbosa var. corymbosa TaxID=529605 RepID=A0AAV1CT78_OLDCO|nr:OLC1v1034433C1 [Oldenlandia corymbosa var. corymbosa]
MANQKQPHFVLIPFMAQGHMIPSVDLGRMLARRGVIITIFTTPVNAKRFDSVLAQAVGTGLPIHVIQIDFPAAENGLPEGCECFDMLTSVESTLKFFAACKMLQPSVEQKLKELKPSPSCILADMNHTWANQVAEKFGIPRLIFQGFCCLTLLCKHNLSKFKELDDIISDSEYFTVPDMPHQIELTKAQTAGLDRPLVPQWKDLHKEIEEAENGSLGVVVNTFEELEPDFIAWYRKATGEQNVHHIRRCGACAAKEMVTLPSFYVSVKKDDWGKG